MRFFLRVSFSLSRSGTIEFTVGPEYYHKKERTPAPLAMLFLVEVTAQSVRNGVLHSFCNAMRALLPTLPPKIRLGIATFGTLMRLEFASVCSISSFIFDNCI